MFFRVDNIRSVKPGAVEERMDKYGSFYEKLKENLWGILWRGVFPGPPANDRKGRQGGGVYPEPAGAGKTLRKCERQCAWGVCIHRRCLRRLGNASLAPHFHIVTAAGELGHNPATTEKYYAHVINEAKARAGVVRSSAFDHWNRKKEEEQNSEGGTKD